MKHIKEEIFSFYKAEISGEEHTLMDKLQEVHRIYDLEGRPELLLFRDIDEPLYNFTLEFEDGLPKTRVSQGCYEDWQGKDPSGFDMDYEDYEEGEMDAEIEECEIPTTELMRIETEEQIEGNRAIVVREYQMPDKIISSKEITIYDYTKDNIVIEKGQELGKFMLGSTVICVFENRIQNQLLCFA